MDNLKIHTCGSLKLPASIIAIGAFDGVHKGHQKLILSERYQSENLKIPLVVYSFDPPPRVFFQNVRLLSPLHKKLGKFKWLGVQHVVVAPFDDIYAAREVDYFHQELNNLNPVSIWVGSDFQYGAGRKGNVDLLSEQFNVNVLKPVRCESGKVISSSRIRQLYEDKTPAEAYRLLGWDEEYKALSAKETINWI